MNFMKTILNMNDFGSEVTGQNTPDPLRFAFSRKKSAHAGGMANMIPESDRETQVLSALQNTQPTTAKRCLYVHIPFCRVRCTYCNFFQYASSRSLIEDYFSALLVELKFKASQPWTQAAPFQAVYIGGGTPTDLSPEQVRRLGQAIREHFPD